MTIAFYQKLQDWLVEGDVAIATVMQASGSVPREVGAKMLIRANGEMFGTIGGGAGEAKVIHQAVQFLHDAQARKSDKHEARKGWVEIDLTGNQQRDTQGVCGGVMNVWVECWSDTWGGAIAQTILQHLKNGTSISLIIPFATDSLPYLTHDISSHPGIDLANQRYVDRIVPSPTLLIIGAGHVGMALAKSAAFIGFRVVVQDDRPDVWRPDTFPSQTQYLKEAIAPALDKFQWPENLYIALVTRGVTFDQDALSLILNRVAERPPRYIGMIGSQKRVRHVFRELERQGITGDRLNQIHAPIGIEIGALTPEEIAISICAELIRVRRMGNRQHSFIDERRSLRNR
jgi:xanthine dehydrogenase accessory factor